MHELDSMLLAALMLRFLYGITDTQSGVCLWQQASNRGLGTEGQRLLDLLPMLRCPLQWPVSFLLRFYLLNKADLGRCLEGQVVTARGFNPIYFLAVGKE